MDSRTFIHQFCSSLFFLTFVAIAEKSQLHFKGIEIEAIGTLGKDDKGMSMISEITENVTLRIINESDSEQAMKILEKNREGVFNFQFDEKCDYSQFLDFDIINID